MKQKNVPPCCFQVGEKIHLYSHQGLQILETLPETEELVVGTPFRTLSLEPFAFPFTHRGRIRDALKMQYRHLLPHPEAVEILPLIFSRKGKQSRGAAWIWSREEGRSQELSLRKEGQRILYWPLPLLFMPPPDKGEREYWALGCQEKGSGASLVIFREGVPFQYRYSRHLPREEQLRGELGEDLHYAVVHPEDPKETPQEFWQRWNTFWNAYPQFHEMDLSAGGVEHLFAWDERLVPLLHFMGALLAGGVLFAGFLGYSIYETRQQQDLYEEKMSLAYAEVFPKDRIRDPLSQARGKLRALGTPGEKSGMDLEEVLIFLGDTWKDLPPGVVAESLRFTSQRAEVVGSAPEVSHIQQIRRAFPQGNLQASLEGVQQIPGSSSIRFTIYVGATKP